MLAAGANERGLKYRIAVKYVDFILFIKKAGKKGMNAGQECWWKLPHSPPSPPAVPRGQSMMVRMLQACEAVAYQGGGMGAGCIPQYSTDRLLVLEGWQGSGASLNLL